MLPRRVGGSRWMIRANMVARTDVASNVDLGTLAAVRGPLVGSLGRDKIGVRGRPPRAVSPR
jgi:hypothetical protein